MSKERDREAFSNFVRALAFASRKHSQQRRKDADASPYINHPIALVSILAVEAGINDCDTLGAALLHDTIEDTDTSVEELVEAFGGPVASLVQEVTDDKRLPKAERKLRQVEHAAHLSPKARPVKLADKIANLRDVADSPPVNLLCGDARQECRARISSRSVDSRLVCTSVRDQPGADNRSAVAAGVTQISQFI